MAELRAELLRVAQGDADDDIDGLQQQARAWSSGETLRYQTLFRGVDSEAKSVLVRRSTLSCAPLTLVSGAWLQWLSSPGNADEELVLRVLSLFASDVGVGHPHAARGHAYLDLLRQQRLAGHAVPSASLALDQRISEAAFYLPAVLLAMSRHPDDFLPEILGADLCLRTVGLLPALSIVKEALPTGADWPAIAPDTARETGDETGLTRSRAAVDHFVASAENEANRVWDGFLWALAAVRRWSDELHQDLVACCDPAAEMAEVLRMRAREGAVYHHDFALEGKPLSEWLREAQTDPTGLMRVLAESKLVKRGRSAKSPLVNGLLSERGPMFRVFSAHDVQVISRWIDALSPEDLPPPHEPARVSEVPFLFLPSLAAGQSTEKRQERQPITVRDAYHQLLRRTVDTPGLRDFAVRYVRGWLGRSRHQLDRSAHSLPQHWPARGLRPWLVEQHERHGREFEEGSDLEVPTREALVDSTVQLAPLTLIDGGWIQGFTDYEHASSEVGHFLFDTYWDELGNGEPRLNHPRIYRELLDQMGVKLPPTASRDFASWPGFRDSSFELPLYWLSIGRMPRTFTPEILGLNLAMELSGVGGSYRRARIGLEAHGFSTRFVDIHNTIDNVTTGHSAWAADAVDTYMAELAVRQGAPARAATWDRVRAGYRSLNPPSGFRARWAGRRAARAHG
ncbi:iron-containing redox enzyme family protein [Streptomyces noursei]|uniref:iron-containing redox enzyme family protein n=1 Tax=Streptomyces noursei TaxID=1971 RepID=UPI001E2CDFC2|nr:iron-containing redox enzyme family protein [Streptomyces noursei]MCZ1018938.1 iron-containing redox enzyme family protein [Streptomyces noursei]